MLEKLKEEVLKANLALVKHGLVIFTWGNVSGIDRESNLVVIKPSGVSYDDMKASDMVVVNMDGSVVEGDLSPSSDTPTHLELYKRYEKIGGIVHTHSENATSFCQAGKEIVAYGTTHADYFYGNVPVTRALTEEEVLSSYEKNTGKVIIETFDRKRIDEMAIPGVLVKYHAPFAWGTSSLDAVHNAVVLEEISKMALKAKVLNPSLEPIDQVVLDKHYNRKHGKNAYYGQKKV